MGEKLSGSVFGLAPTPKEKEKKNSDKVRWINTEKSADEKWPPPFFSVFHIIQMDTKTADYEKHRHAARSIAQRKQQIKGTGLRTSGKQIIPRQTLVAKRSGQQVKTEYHQDCHPTQGVQEIEVARFFCLR